MKKYLKLAALLVIITVLLCGCAVGGDIVTTTTVPEEKPFQQMDLICMPDLSWNMAPDEVVDVLKLDASEYAMQSDLMIVEKPTCFGAPADQLAIQFAAREDGGFAILQMGITYPDDADMDGVYRQLCALYGDPEEEHRFYIPDISVIEDVEQGRVNDSYRVENGIPVEVKSSGDGMKYWSGTQTLHTYLNEEELNAFHDRYFADLPEDAFREYAENQVLTYLFWTNSGGDDFLPQSAKNMVVFKNVQLSNADQVRGGDDIVTTITTPEEKPFPQTELMCLPGLKWGMSQEEVAAALDLPAEDIVGKGYIQYFDGMEVLGYPAEKVIVLFNGGEPRLSRIGVYFPDDTDMEAVKRQLKLLYGEPAERITVYAVHGLTYNAANETLEEHLANLPESTPATVWETDAHNLFWTSDKVLADLLAPDELEAWITMYPEIYQPYFREYVENQISGCVFMSDNYGNQFVQSDEYKNLLLFYGTPFAETACEIRNIWR